MGCNDHIYCNHVGACSTFYFKRRWFYSSQSATSPTSLVLDNFLSTGKIMTKITWCYQPVAPIVSFVCETLDIRHFFFFDSSRSFLFWLWWRCWSLGQEIFAIPSNRCKQHLNVTNKKRNHILKKTNLCALVLCHSLWCTLWTWRWISKAASQLLSKTCYNQTRRWHFVYHRVVASDFVFEN